MISKTKPSNIKTIITNTGYYDVSNKNVERITLEFDKDFRPYYRVQFKLNHVKHFPMASVDGVFYSDGSVVSIKAEMEKR